MSEERRSLPVSHSRVSLATITSSGHANLLGNVHGGEIMKLADSTAGAVAARHSDGPAVTAFMDEMAFLAPVHVGDIVRSLAQVNWVGTSSMEIGSGSRPSRGGVPPTSRSTSPRRTSCSWRSTPTGTPAACPASSRRPPRRYAASARPVSAAPTGSPRRPRSTRAGLTHA